MKPTNEQHPTRYFCGNPETHRLEEVFPESEIGDDELVIPKFWGGHLGYRFGPSQKAALAVLKLLFQQA